MTGKSESSNNVSSCPACSSDQIDNIVLDGPPVCSDCGLVVDGEAERGVPDGNFGPTEADSGTQQEWGEYASVSNSTEKNLVEALNQIERITAHYELPDAVRNEAADVYAEAAITSYTDGRPTEAVVTTAVYLAARSNGHPIPLNRIHEPLNADSSKVTSYLMSMQGLLERTFGVSSAIEYLPFFRRELDLDVEVLNRAKELLADKPEDRRMGGANPVGFTAAALYVASEGAFTQRELADVVGLSTETIRVRLNDLRRYQHYE